ncbi:MAG TPA: DnaB-like helicase C-terminal domain-containing protein [Tepidisphaeraceae bacterium]|nr:DnaB-like helicase C-terminal domain-containing protein [Tepidisphaeraceae bacterium]
MHADNPIASPFDRLPPNSIESEMCYLASLMLCTDRGTARILRHALRPEDFFQTDHRIIFEAAAALLDRGKPLDAMLLRAELDRRQMLNEVGGVEYLAQILNGVPNHANGDHYAAVVREKASLRALITLANDTIRGAYAPATDDKAAQLAMQLASQATRVATTGTATRVWKLGDIAAEVYAAMEGGTSNRVPTGFRDFDAATGGLRRGSKTIVAGKPGMGKSVFIKQLALNAVRQGIPFGLVTVEESRHKVAENALANVSGINNHRISSNQLTPEDWGPLAQGLARVGDLPYFVVDTARRVSDIVAVVHKLVAEHGCQIVAVDHLHIIDSECDENRERQVSKISAELKWVWKDLNVVGIEAAQLNRAGGCERPGLHNLRDSGSLEQDGDVVLFLHREDYYRHQKNRAEMDNIVEVIIAKQKDGRTGVVPMAYDGAHQRITDLDPNDPLALEGPGHEGGDQ